MNEYDFAVRAVRERSASKDVMVAEVVKVISFDPQKLTVSVKPLNKKLNQGVYKTSPQILSVPVAMTYGGGFLVRPWYKMGDIGVVLYCNGDIDKAVSDGAEVEPNTERSHDPLRCNICGRNSR